MLVMLFFLSFFKKGTRINILSFFVVVAVKNLL